MIRVLAFAVSLSLASFSAAVAETPTIDVVDAVRDGDVAALEIYAAAGGDLELRTSRGYTPFIMAAYYGQTATLAYLKTRGVQMCARDDQGSNAFMGVAFRGHVETMTWLLANSDCGVNSQNNAGQTALMMASLFGREDMVALLLRNGVDPKIADRQGNTAESLAQAQGLTKVVQMVRFPLGR